MKPIIIGYDNHVWLGSKGDIHVVRLHLLGLPLFQMVLAGEKHESVLTTNEEIQGRTMILPMFRL